MRAFCNWLGSCIVEFFSPFWRGAKIAITLATAICLFMLFLGLFVAAGSSGHALRLADTGLARVHNDTVFGWHEAYGSRIPAAKRPAQPAGESPALAALTKTTKPVAVLTYDSLNGQAPSASEFASLVDEVVINRNIFGGALVLVSCPGGGVTEYGQLYAEMQRIKKEAGLPLVVCVDQMAASGGYMMILPADHIVAAPFATIGSIGVVSEMLNYHELLKKLGVQSVTITAGKYKRTVTPTDEVTEENKRLYQEKLAAVHAQFIAKVVSHRKGLDPDKACNANTWTAEESLALKLGLVDELGTSHDLLLKLNEKNVFVRLSTAKKEDWKDQFTASVVDILDRVAQRVEGRLIDSRSPRNQPQAIAP